ncbi:MAG: hypothetical protein ABWK00_05245 [Desulfurococcaceae archaeon]
MERVRAKALLIMLVALLMAQTSSRVSSADTSPITILYNGMVSVTASSEYVSRICPMCNSTTLQLTIYYEVIVNFTYELVNGHMFFAGSYAVRPKGIDGSLGLVSRQLPPEFVDDLYASLKVAGTYSGKDVNDPPLLISIGTTGPELRQAPRNGDLVDFARMGVDMYHYRFFNAVYGVLRTWELIDLYVEPLTGTPVVVSRTVNEVGADGSSLTVYQFVNGVPGLSSLEQRIGRTVVQFRTLYGFTGNVLVLSLGDNISYTINGRCISLDLHKASPLILVVSTDVSSPLANSTGLARVEIGNAEVFYTPSPTISTNLSVCIANATFLEASNAAPPEAGANVPSSSRFNAAEVSFVVAFELLIIYGVYRVIGLISRKLGAT